MPKRAREASWEVSDALWERVEPLLPKAVPKTRGHGTTRRKVGGRPRVPAQRVFAGILYVLRTGCQWKAAPAEFGSGSSLHRYFQAWVRRGVFRKLWRLGLLEYDQRKHIQWRWQSLDGALTKAPLGGEKNREKPDRSRENWRQAFGADRRPRRADWRGAAL